MKINSIRGVKDLFGDDVKLYNFIQGTALNVAKNYLFREIKTPIIEYSDVFIRNLGETSDIVNKEIYQFADRNGDNICLRPEFTAGVVRAFINNLQNLPLPLKLYSSGPLFRYERPQRGRRRQFHQVNFEIIGAAEYQLDTELILLANDFLKKLGLNGFTLELNSLGCGKSREGYKNALLCYLDRYKTDLSEHSKDRLVKNPLRILDSKDNDDQEIINGAPKIIDFLTNDSKEFFQSICSSLESLGIEFRLNSKLVRGLDYYSHTIFEFKSQELGAQNTILAGGRYEELVSNLGGKNIPGIGFAAGIERLMEVTKLPSEEDKRIVSIVPIGDAAEKKAVELSYMLRCKNFEIDLHYNLSLRSRMKKAEKSFAAIIFGDDEIKDNTAKLKFMKTGDEKIISLSKDSQLESCLSVALRS